MTGQPLDLRRHTARRPAGALLRVAAAIAALTVPSVLVLTVWPPFGSTGCRGDRAVDETGVPVPCVDSVRTSADEIFWAIVITGLVQLAILGGYVALRRSSTPPCWLPVALGIVALSLGAVVPLSDATTSIWVWPLYALWLAAPLILYYAQRGDPGAIIPIFLALAVSCAVGLLDGAGGAPPAIMLFVSALLLGIRYAVVRRRS